MTGEWRYDLEPSVSRCETAILKIVGEIAPTARLNRIGPIDINGPSWSCWVITETDQERDRLAGDKLLRARLERAAAEFPPNAFAFQSQETVDRDFRGSWFYAMR
jgi:hypothetical protein